MELKNLEAFLLLARSLNFTRSAEQMFLSQSAFSRQIIRLEEELGCQLFNRTKRNVELTTFGKNFLEHAEKIVAEYNKCIYHLSCAGNDEGHLRLGLLNDLIDDIFPKIIRSFIKDNPEIAITYTDNGMSGLINNVLRDEIDCAYTLSYDTDKLAEISSFSVWAQPLYVALSASHPLSKKGSLCMADLSGYPFIMILPDTYNLGMIHINYLCKNAGFTPNVAAVVSNINSLMMLVNSNIGVGITARTAEYISPEGVVLIPIKPDSEDQLELQTEIAILWKTNNSNPAIAKFVESARKSLGMGV